MSQKRRFKIGKGKLSEIPETLDSDKVYVGIAEEEGEASKIIIEGKEWVSKEYVDKLEEEMRRFKLVASASLNDLNKRIEEMEDLYGGLVDAGTY